MRYGLYDRFQAVNTVKSVRLFVCRVQQTSGSCDDFGFSSAKFIASVLSFRAESIAFLSYRYQSGGCF
jgi:hypothetical protein